MKVLVNVYGKDNTMHRTIGKIVGDLEKCAQGLGNAFLIVEDTKYLIREQDAKRHIFAIKG